MLLQLLIFVFIQLCCCIWTLTSLHAGIRTDISTENEIPNHLHPRSMVRQVVIKIRSHFLHLTTHNIAQNTYMHSFSNKLTLYKLTKFSCHLQLGMYRIAIYKIRPEPDSTGYQTNYPARTGYLDTSCIIANFLVYFVLRIENVLFPVFVLSIVLVYMTHYFLQYGAHSLGELSSTNCQKRPSTIWLRYPVPGTVLAGTGAGFEKMVGYPATRNRISGTSLFTVCPTAKYHSGYKNSLVTVTL